MYVTLHGLALILVSSKLHWTPRLGVKMVRIGLRISLSHILTVKATVILGALLEFHYMSLPQAGA